MEIDDNAGVLTPQQIAQLGKPETKSFSCMHPAPKNIKLTCGHKLDTSGFPSVNCADCWKVFFIANKEMTEQNCKVIAEGREVEVIQTHGSKYLKQLKRFAAFVYEMVEAEKNKEQDGN